MVPIANLPEDLALPVHATLDQRIARLLWIWARDRDRILDDDRSVQQHIAGCLEWFLCDAFQYSAKSARQGWWSDGVIDLQIEQIAGNAFRAFGSTYWDDRQRQRRDAHAKNKDGRWVGPFEIEFYLASKDFLEFARTIVRFGWKDKNGNVVRSSDCLHPRLRKAGRQLLDSDWAMAIELTPAKET